ncbi:hypothetical protein ACHAQH_002584 [Verticillium albo-atrum]
MGNDVIQQTRSRLDPELAAILSTLASATNGKPGPEADVKQIRVYLNKFMHNMTRSQPYPENVLQTKIPIPTPDGATSTLHRFATQEIADAPTLQPAVLHVHGGGMISGSVSIYAPAIARYVAHSGLSFFSVEYRLAPEHPGDGPFTDVYAALGHLSAHAAEWNVEPARLAVMGESAGGGLAAGAALLARDRGLTPPLAKQILVYPMLDDRTTLPDWSALGKYHVWSAGYNRTAWEAVVGADKAGRADAEVLIYVAPGRAGDLTGLASAYVEIGGLDLFVGETIAYVDRLAAGEVDVEFHLLPGLTHGFDGFGRLSWA